MGKAHVIQLGSLELRSDGILHAIFDFGGTPTTDAAAEYPAMGDELIGSLPVPVLLEIVRIPCVDRSIREFLMGGMTPPVCRAVVVSDPTYLTMFRTFQLVDTADVPTSVFSTVEKAVDWIHAQTSSG